MRNAERTIAATLDSIGRQTRPKLDIVVVDDESTDGSVAIVQRALGADCRSIAAPFGEGDERFVRIARQCGYANGFTTDPGLAALGQAVLCLPRVEVIGGWSLDAFLKAVQAP